jgi:hypothetical protein
MAGYSVPAIRPYYPRVPAASQAGRVSLSRGSTPPPPDKTPANVQGMEYQQAQKQQNPMLGPVPPPPAKVEQVPGAAGPGANQVDTSIQNAVTGGAGGLSLSMPQEAQDTWGSRFKASMDSAMQSSGANPDSPEFQKNLLPVFIKKAVQEADTWEQENNPTQSQQMKAQKEQADLQYRQAEADKLKKAIDGVAKAKTPEQIAAETLKTAKAFEDWKKMVMPPDKAKMSDKDVDAEVNRRLLPIVRQQTEDARGSMFKHAPTPEEIQSMRDQIKGQVQDEEGIPHPAPREEPQYSLMDKFKNLAGAPPIMRNLPTGNEPTPAPAPSPAAAKPPMMIPPMQYLQNPQLLYQYMINQASGGAVPPPPPQAGMGMPGQTGTGMVPLPMAPQPMPSMMPPTGPSATPIPPPPAPSGVPPGGQSMIPQQTAGGPPAPSDQLPMELAGVNLRHPDIVGSAKVMKALMDPTDPNHAAALSAIRSDPKYKVQLDTQ